MSTIAENTGKSNSSGKSKSEKNKTPQPRENKNVENDNNENEQNQNNEQKDEELDGINTASDKMVSDNAKNKANNAKNKAKEKAKAVVKNKKVMAFIATHIVPISIILLIIVFVIWLIGVFGFFTTLPGMILEKVKEFGRSIWGDFVGFFIGDSVGAEVSQDDMINLAQYIQSMGYEDLRSCGFGDVVYEESEENIENEESAETGETGENEEDDESEEVEEDDGSEENDEDNPTSTYKQIKKIKKSVDGKNYLKEYIAANESTWALANWSVLGAIDETASAFKAVVKLDLNSIESNENRSTGMINILDTRTPLQQLVGDKSVLAGSWLANELGLNKAAEYVKINRKEEKMVVYTDAIYNPIINLFTDATIRWGSVFSYDMSTWTAKYGRPTELFLAVHLSTMMPDLAYEIATNSKLNTKVNLVFQDVNIEYTTNVSKDGNNFSTDDIVDAFLNYGVAHEPLTIGFENGPHIKKDPYQEILNAINGIVDEEERKAMKENFFAKLMSQSNSLSSTHWGLNYWEAFDRARNSQDTILGNIRGVATSVITAHWNIIINGMGWIVDALDCGLGESLMSLFRVDVKNGTDIVSDPKLSQYGITYNDLIELAQVAGKGIEGIKNVKWPYIESVTSHWFYNDIDFSKGVYRRAKAATKTIDYEPRDDKEESSIVKNNIKVKLDAILTSDQGIVYQVCEPEATGPNQAIVDIFKDKYYKYDGTEQTAKAIDNAKRYDELGRTGYNNSGINVEEPTVEKQEVSFEDNKVNALTAFSILENMHSEEGDFVYRNLKELMHTLDYFNEEDLTEELKEMLLWLIQVDEPDGKEERFNVTRDPGEYGIVIKDVEGRTVLAPENCEISSDGDVVTLTFTGLSDETVELLEYIYKDDFKIIEKDAIAGITMKIKGMELDASGTASRGEVIGTANGDLEVVMLDVDKSHIEDVEEYMKQSNNNAYYQAVLNAKNKIYGEGIDIGHYNGSGVSRGDGASSGNSVVSYGHGKWSYNDSDFDLMCAITRQEAGVKAVDEYAEDLNVLTTACNRAERNGTDPLTEYMKPNQYTYSIDGKHAQWLGGKYSENVVKAVKDALNGKRSHDYVSFRNYPGHGRVQLVKGGNYYGYN